MPVRRCIACGPPSGSTRIQFLSFKRRTVIPPSSAVVRTGGVRGDEGCLPGSLTVEGRAAEIHAAEVQETGASSKTQLIHLRRPE
jgi:hypothetical protein